MDESNNKVFFEFPFSVAVNGREICKTVSELYDDCFLVKFNEAIGQMLPVADDFGQTNAWCFP